jgi:hypothetical protein
MSRTWLSLMAASGAAVVLMSVTVVNHWTSRLPSSGSLAQGPLCDVAYNSWRGLNAESPNCLHGYLRDQIKPNEECLDDPMLCAAAALETQMRTTGPGNTPDENIANPSRVRGQDVWPRRVSGPGQADLGSYQIAFPQGHHPFLPANYKANGRASTEMLAAVYLGNPKAESTESSR